VFPLQEQASVIAVWIAHTWVFNAFEYTPYLFVFSAAKRSGKSRVLEVVEQLAKNAELVQSASAASLIRSIDEANPATMLLDEVDALYSRGKNDPEVQNTTTHGCGWRRAFQSHCPLHRKRGPTLLT
jgi:hypothetical protein